MNRSKFKIKAKTMFFTVVMTSMMLASCSTTKKVSILEYSTPLPENTIVDVIGIGQKVPEGARLLGHVKIGDSGFSVNCTYDKVIASAQTQARSIGGNLLQITKHKTPNILTSTCHRIEGDVYFIKK